MPNCSKIKGTAYERELVNQARASGIHAKRSPGSNGEAIGEHREVDIVVGGQRGQAKIRKAIASYITPSQNVDFQVIRESRGKSFVVLEWCNYLQLLKAAGISDNGPSVDKVD